MQNYICAVRRKHQERESNIKCVRSVPVNESTRAWPEHVLNSMYVVAILGQCFAAAFRAVFVRQCHSLCLRHGQFF